VKALSCGEILWDIIRGQAHLGGASFNLAAHLARCGARSFLVSRVGNDSLGRRALARARGLGVDTRWVRRDPDHPTGTVTVTLDAGGQPSYTIHRDVAYDHLRVTREDLDAIAAQQFDVVCFGTLQQRSPMTRESLYRILDRLRGTAAFYDVNLRRGCHRRNWIEDSLRRATIVKLNHEEAHVLGRRLFSRRLSERSFAEAVRSTYGARLVLITRGAKGCAVSHGRRFDECPGTPVKVVDAVGAGDSFSAVFLFRVLSGADPAVAAEAANRMGAFVASHRGAIPAYTPSIRRALLLPRG